MAVERDLSLKKPDQEKSTTDAGIFAHNLEALRAKPQLLTNLVQTYRQIFGEAPWNEWMNCSNCERKYGRTEYLEDMHKANPCCLEQNLVEFHPAEKVEQMLASDLSVPASTPFLFVAQEKKMGHTGNSEISGFIWGYSASLDIVLNKVIADMPTKYGVKMQNDMLTAAPRIIKERLAKENLSDKVSYITEIGVAGNRRDGVVLGQLMQSVTESQRPASKTYLFWTQKQAKIYPIINLLDGKTIYSFDEKTEGDQHVFMAGDMDHAHDIFKRYPLARLRSYFIAKMREKRGQT